MLKQFLPTWKVAVGTVVLGVVGVALGLIAVHLWQDHVGHHQVVDLINACAQRPDCKAVLFGGK